MVECLLSAYVKEQGVDSTLASCVVNEVLFACLCEIGYYGKAVLGS
jgi:hypothetical protein